MSFSNHSTAPRAQGRWRSGGDAQPVDIFTAGSLHLAPRPRSFTLCWRLRCQAQILFSWPRALSHHLPSLLLRLLNKSRQGLAASSAGLLLCALLKSYAVLLCKRQYKESLPCGSKQHKHFLNETSQTQRQIPARSIGRRKLFRCMRDCQEEFCKCFNEAWTAPRRGCQKLIPDDLQYRSSSSSVFPSKSLGFDSFLFRN